MAPEQEAASKRPKRRHLVERLVSALSSADSGSRQLDLIVSYILDQGSDETGEMIRLLVQEGYAWDAVEDLLKEDVPYFTTALDDSLPGENIVLSLFSPRRKRWIALHKASDDSLVRGIGETECLARRAAAVKARLKNAELETKEDLRSASGSDEPPAEDSPPENGEGELDDLLLKRILSRSAPENPDPTASQKAARTAAKDTDGEEWKVLF